MPHSHDENDPTIPTLTRRVADTAGGVHPLSSAVLQTLLQAEIERAVNRAIDEAMDGVRLRLEKEIPAIIARTLRRVDTQIGAQG